MQNAFSHGLNYGGTGGIISWRRRGGTTAGRWRANRDILDRRRRCAAGVTIGVRMIARAFRIFMLGFAASVLDIVASIVALEDRNSLIVARGPT
jgi:hypothetical protein